jgi:hypothetical protein
MVQVDAIVAPLLHDASPSRNPRTGMDEVMLISVVAPMVRARMSFVAEAVRVGATMSKTKVAVLAV